MMRITAGRLAAWVYAFFSWLMHGPGVAAAWTWKVADQPAAEVAPPVPAPDVAWRRVAESYRTGPVGERVRIGVMTPRPSRPMPDDPDAAAIEEFLRRGGPGGEEQRGVVFLRIADPAAVAAARDGLGEPSLPMAVTSPVRALLTGRVVLLEMGDLRVHAEPGRLMIARRSVPGGVVLRTLDGPITIDHLREVMPPIMLPQLALALGTEDGNEPLVPGLPPVEWETSQRIRESGRPRLVIRGRGGSAAGDWRVEAVIDEATHRLSRVVLTGPAPGSGAGPAGVEWFISPIDPGDPASWRIDTAGRIAVDSIDKLRSAPPAPAVDHSARVQAGERLPPLHLYNAGTEAWANEASSAGRFAGVVPEEMDRFRIALLMYLPAAHANNREARERFRLWRSALGRGAAEAALAVAPLDAGVAVFAAGVAMIELDRFDEARRAAAREWSSDADVADRAIAADLLCSPAGRVMHARFSEDSAPIVLVVDQTLTVHAVVVGSDAQGSAAAGTAVGGKAVDPARRLADRIREAIMDGL